MILLIHIMISIWRKKDILYFVLWGLHAQFEFANRLGALQSTSRKTFISHIICQKIRYRITNAMSNKHQYQIKYRMAKVCGFMKPEYSYSIARIHKNKSQPVINKKLLSNSGKIDRYEQVKSQEWIHVLLYPHEDL
jgi:hypothetical protein